MPSPEARRADCGPWHLHPDASGQLLEYRADLPIGVVEAKRTRISAADGIEQAKCYALRLGLPFAYATNSQAIYEINLLVGRINIVATGTGKTMVAFQIVARLRQADWIPGRKPRALYLADRNILADRPRIDHFTPAFRDVVHRIPGEAVRGEERVVRVRREHRAFFATFEVRAGFRVTTPVRAIVESAATGMDQDILDSAVADVLDRGAATRRQLL